MVRIVKSIESSVNAKNRSIIALLKLLVKQTVALDSGSMIGPRQAGYKRAQRVSARQTHYFVVTAV